MTVLETRAKRRSKAKQGSEKNTLRSLSSSRPTTAQRPGTQSRSCPDPWSQGGARRLHSEPQPYLCELSAADHISDGQIYDYQLCLRFGDGILAGYILYEAL